MTHPVDAKRQSGGDGQPAGNQLPAEAGSIVLAGIGRMARADHRQLRNRQGSQVATAVEQQRGGRDLFEQSGIGGVIRTQDMIAGLGGPAQRLFDNRLGPSHLLDLSALQTKSSQGAVVGVEQGDNVTAKMGQQASGGDRTDTGDGIQRQPQRESPGWKRHVRSC